MFSKKWRNATWRNAIWRNAPHPQIISGDYSKPTILGAICGSLHRNYA